LNPRPKMFRQDRYKLSPEIFLVYSAVTGRDYAINQRRFSFILNWRHKPFKTNPLIAFYPDSEYLR